MLSFLAVCALVTVVGSKDAADAAGAIGVLVGFGVSGTLFLVRSRALPGRERLGWTLIGVGLLLAALGVLTVGVVFFAVGDAPAFGWTDGFFFATYGFVIAGFATLPHTSGTRLHRWRIALDGLIGALSVGALMWVFFLSDVLRGLESGGVATRLIGGTYPFLDLALVTVVTVVLLRRSVYRFDGRLAIFAVGIVAQVFSDIAFLVSGISGSFDQAEPLYVLNLAAVGAYFLSAYLLEATPQAREYAERKTPLWTMLLPYGSAFAMVIVLLVYSNSLAMANTSRVLLDATIVVGLLVVIRQGVSIIENRRLVEEQRNSLVSSISHELRTPLTSIVGFIELLEHDDGHLSRDERREMIEIVRQQVHYMSRIVSDLIMLARGSGNDLHLEVEPSPFHSLLEASIHASGVARQSVTVECSRELVGFVDADRMQQVLVNLLTNAARYGGPHRLIRVAIDGSDLVVEVHDDGPGIPRRFELTVWERFERGPNRLNATVPGSGIGLSIVEAIAGAHGGTARYRTSEVLGGACFSVELPGRATLGKAPRGGAALSEVARVRPVA